MSQIEAAKTLDDISYKVQLGEGSEGVRLILRTVFRFGPIPLHDLARKISIPVPLVSAVRRELEKQKLLDRKSGLVLTDKGNELLRALGVCNRVTEPLTMSYQIPSYLNGLITKLREIVVDRPKPKFSLDQSHATMQTCMLRIAYLYEHDAIDGRDIVFLGDDDLMALALHLFAEEMGITTGTTTVFDLDSRVIEFIENISDKRGWVINGIKHDLRNPFKTQQRDKYDVFFCDPPYTAEGFRVFTSRGVELLRSHPGKKGFICFGAGHPDELADALSVVTELGLVIREIVPSFNRYIGAQMHAQTSNMIRCDTSNRASSVFHDSFELNIYTAAKNKNRRDRR